MGISIFGPLQAPSLRRSPPLPPTGRHGVEGGAMEDETVSVGRARPFLNTRQAGHYLGLTPRHLERLRAQGRGPNFRRHCRSVVYHIDDLDAWSAATSREAPTDDRHRVTLPLEDRLMLG